MLEPAETNPFLELFYEDPERYAFPVQMFYLVSRWRQQAQIRQPDLFEGTIVSDYLFDKDRLFAEMTLEALELELYQRFAGALGEQAPTPDLVVLLDAPTDVLLGRIRQRQAPGEHKITAGYLEGLRARYEVLFRDWTRCPITRLDNQDMNYLDDPFKRQEVLATLEAALSGRQPDAPGSADREAQPELFGTG